jgi:uncharacterized protein involved in response to NO
MTTISGGIPRLRAWRGPALLAYGFRPFFLAAGIWAVVALPLWLLALAGHLALPTAFDPVAWHAHEMLLGFAMAAVAGFVLTAVPNWTGRLPLNGVPLAALALLWLAGRLAVLAGAWIGALPAAALDLAFPLALAAAVVREVAAGRNWRNLPVCGGLVALLLANLLMHLEPLGVAATSAVGERLAIATLALLVTLIGGRIVPSFTANWLKRRGVTGLPAPLGRLDRAALALGLVALLAWVVAPEALASGLLLVVAAVAHALRLARWQGAATWREPLLAVLHLGYAWLVLGLLGIGIDAIGGTVGPHLHGLTVGAFGTMILAVMTRAILGHTGRALAVGPATVAAYALVSLAALARLAATAFGDAYMAWLEVAGVAWLLAFALFLGAYGPMLLRPRIDGRPG